MATKTVYDDERYINQASKLDAEKKAELNEVDVTYGNVISSSDKYYQDQINASKDYAETQKKNQQEQTDFAIEKIEQQKDQAHKDYIKEQSGAYVDWQKQSNPYGVESEKRAAAGLAGTGYAESSQVSMYNTYQNRVASARESYQRAVLNYENAINDARLQNNAQLAEIAFNALQQQLELSLQGFQYKNQLVLEQAQAKRDVKNSYTSRYQAIIDQINREDALAEEKRQADLANKRQMEQIAIAQAAQRLDEQKFAYQKQQDAEAKALAAAKAAQAAASAKAATSKSAGSSSYSKKVTQDEKKLHGTKTTTNKSTYTKAAEKMQKAGVATGDGGLMTKTEWKRRKASGSNRAETSYATYEDYVNSFTAWRMQNPEK